MNISKFEIRPSKQNGQFRAYIIGKNGEILFWSEQYTVLRNALQVISLVDPYQKHMIDFLDVDGGLQKRIEAK